MMASPDLEICSSCYLEALSLEFTEGPDPLDWPLEDGWLDTQLEGMENVAALQVGACCGITMLALRGTHLRRSSGFRNCDSVQHATACMVAHDCSSFL